MARSVFTAEDSSGEIWYIASRPGYSRKDFADDVLVWVRAEDGDVAPHQLDLYEWESIEQAGEWLLGIAPQGKKVTATAWGDMARAAEFGSVAYDYPGEFYYRDRKAVA